MIAVKVRAGGLGPKFHGASFDETLEPSELKGLDLPVIRFRLTDEPYVRRRVTHHEFMHHAS